MQATQARDSSVMFHLAELQNIADSRAAEDRQKVAAREQALEAERALEAQRRRDERLQLIAQRSELRERRLTEEARLAAAERQLRIETEARLEQQKMELLIRQADAQVAAAEATRPRSRAGMWLAMALLLCGQVALLALLYRADDRAAVSQARTLHDVQAVKAQAQTTADAVNAQAAQLDALHTSLAALEAAVAAGATAPDASAPKRPGTSTTRPKPRPTPTPVDIAPVTLPCDGKGGPLCGLNGSR